MDKYLNSIVNTAYNKIINRCKVEILSKQDIDNLDIQWEDLPLEIQGDCLPEAYEIRLNSNIEDFAVLVDTMVHELIHYYVYLEFDQDKPSYLANMYRDDCEIFMMVLAWINPNEELNNFEWNYNFKNTFLYLAVQSCKDFNALYDLIWERYEYILEVVKEEMGLIETE